MSPKQKRDEKISIEGEARVNELRDMFKHHCENESVQLAQLMPLVELIPTIQAIADEKKLNMEVNKRISAIVAKCVRIAGIVSLSITTLFLIIQLIFKLKE